MKTPIDIIHERRKWLQENSIEDWDDFDTIFVMREYLKEVQSKSKNLKQSRVSGSETLSKSKIKKKREVALPQQRVDKCICKTVREAEECKRQCGTMGQ